MKNQTITVNNEVLELVNDGQGCAMCHLAETKRPQPGKVAKCVIDTDGMCLKPGLRFKLKK